MSISMTWAYARTDLSEAGGPIRQVKEWLGHRGITTTADTYGHVTLASDAAVAAILREQLLEYGQLDRPNCPKTVLRADE